MGFVLPILVFLALVAIAFGKDTATGIAGIGCLLFLLADAVITWAIVFSLWPEVGKIFAIVAGIAAGIWIVTKGTKAWLGHAQFIKAQAAEEENKTRCAAWTKSLQKAIASGDPVQVFDCLMAGDEMELSTDDMVGLALPYLEVAANDASEGKRLCALNGLSFRSFKHIDKQVALILDRLSDTTETQQVRLRAVWIIGFGGYDVCLPSLLYHLKDEDKMIRANCCVSVGSLLRWMQGTNANIPAARDTAVPVLLKVLANDELEVRIAAARALVECCDLRALRPLQELSQRSHESQELRQAAADAAELIRLSNNASAT